MAKIRLDYAYREIGSGCAIYGTGSHTAEQSVAWAAAQRAIVEKLRQQHYNPTGNYEVTLVSAAAVDEDQISTSQLIFCLAIIVFFAACSASLICAGITALMK